MAAYVALLHSIILGPDRRVRAADLEAMTADCGFSDPRPVLASGNLIFSARKAPARRLEARLEESCARLLGRPIDIVVREAGAWRRLVAGNPFPEAARAAPAQVAVRVMRAPAPAGLLDVLAPYATPDETMRIVDGDLWVHFAGAISGTRLASAITPKRAGIGTFRNWNTVQRIAKALEG